MPGYDAIVVGLGAMGSAAAYEIACRGRRVLGLDRFRPPHDRGSSHGGSRIIRKAYFEGARYVPLLLRAYERWDRLERDCGRALRTTTGGLWLGPAGSTAVAGSRETAQRYGLDHDLLDAGEIRRRFPTFVPDDGIVGLYEPDAGILDPEAAVSAYLESADRAGADLRFGETVRFWRATRDGVEVATAAGTYTGDRLVLAAGAWAPDLLAGLDLPLSVERQVQVWFRPDGDARPYLADRHPVFVWQGGDGATCYGVPPRRPDTGVKVGFHHGGAATTMGALDREVHPEDVAALRNHLGARTPGLAGRFLRAAVCPYTNTPDEDFVIGPHPQCDQVVLACGFSGHGFKFAPVVGEVLADIAISDSTRQPIAAFRPARFAGADR